MAKGNNISFGSVAASWPGRRRYDASMHSMNLGFMIVLLAALGASCGGTRSQSDNAGVGDSISDAIAGHQSNVPVRGEGTVTRILQDDNAGLPHQRFILKLGSGQTVLIEHNTDVAPRIDDLRTGDAVSFAGEYIWNPQGGLVHWTHHDPAGRHQAGWLKHGGKTYQ